MRELDQVLRLRKDGVRFDYFVIDAFWFDPDGGYRTWRKPNWPDGPDLWLKTCLENGIRPGLWFSTNTLVHLTQHPQWHDSLNKQGGAMSMFEGGFPPDFMQTLQYWYDRGVRMFLFDFADLTAATPASEATLTQGRNRSPQFGCAARCSGSFSPQESGCGARSFQWFRRHDGLHLLSVPVQGSSRSALAGGFRFALLR